MSDEQSDFQKRPRGVLVARSDFIAAAAAVSVLCGAFLPVPAWFLDVAWGCSLCLSTALVLISAAGKDPLELSGFGPLMVFGALLRLGIGAATAALVFRGRVSGTLVEMVGSPISRMGAMTILPGLPVVVGLMASLAFRSAGRMTTTALKCLTETLPEHEGAIALDEQAGLIPPLRARELEERSLRQTGFFVNMGSAAKLLRCDAVVAAIAILAVIVGELALFTTRQTMTPASLHECAAAAAGMAVLMLLPTVVIAFAAARLLERSGRYLAWPQGDDRRLKGQVIEIVSQETGRREQIELLNPDFVEVSEGTAASGAECTAALEPGEGAGREAAHVDTMTSDGDGYYESLAAHVAGLEPARTPVLFAAQASGALPVTVAVNVGMRLADRGLRTLLVDAGAAREAVAAVFEMNADDMCRGPAASCVKNLHVWALRAIVQTDSTALDAAIRKISGNYDLLILYAPDLMRHEHRGRIVSAARRAVVFGGAGEVESFLEQAGCTMIERRPVLDTSGNGLSEHA